LKNELRIKEKEIEDQRLRLAALEKEERTLNERIRGI